MTKLLTLLLALGSLSVFADCSVQVDQSIANNEKNAFARQTLNTSFTTTAQESNNLGVAKENIRQRTGKFDHFGKEIQIAKRRYVIYKNGMKIVTPEWSISSNEAASVLVNNLANLGCK
jgi:hypothetical protein